MRTKTIGEGIKWISDRSDPGCLFSRQIALEYQPGNGTRYVLHLAQLPAAACGGAGAQPGSWSVSLIDGALAGRCCVLAPSGYLDPGYLAEKLRISAREAGDDLAVLAELIGSLLGRQTVCALEGAE